MPTKKSYGTRNQYGRNNSSKKYTQDKNNGRVNSRNYTSSTCCLPKTSMIDIIYYTTAVPTVSQGVYRHEGNQASIVTQLQKFDGTVQQIKNKYIAEMKQFIPVYSVELTIIGTRFKQAQSTCRQFTLCTGIICIIPLFFMCCNWWKKFVNPLYSITAQTYNTVGRFLVNHPEIKNFSLKIADNTFNNQRARSLYVNFSTASPLEKFNLFNMAQPINNEQDQYQRFQQNVSTFKSLPFTMNCVWHQKFIV